MLSLLPVFNPSSANNSHPPCRVTFTANFSTSPVKYYHYRACIRVYNFLKEMRSCICRGNIYVLSIYLHFYKPPLGYKLTPRYVTCIFICLFNPLHTGCCSFLHSLSLLVPPLLKQVACLSTQACIYPFPAPLTHFMLYTHISTSPHIISYSTLTINVRYLDIIIHPLTRDRKWTSAVKSLTYENVCPALLHMYIHGA